MKRLPPVIAVLGAVLVMSSDVRGQQSDAPPPEMKILRRLTGNWQDETLSKVAEWTPEETRTTTTSKVNATLGGRFILSRIFDNEGKLSGIHMFTYDVARQAYRQWFFDSNGAAVESSGKWDASTNTLTLTNQQEGIAGAMTVRFVDRDTIQWSIVSKDRQGKVYLDIQGKSTRQK